MKPNRIIQIFGIICLLGLGWVLGYASSKGGWNDTAAAWVQAFGSVAAIIAGFAYVQWQARLADVKAKADWREARKFSRSQVLAVAEFCRERIRAIVKSSRDHSHLTVGDIRIFSSFASADVNVVMNFHGAHAHSGAIIVAFARLPAHLSGLEVLYRRTLKLLDDDHHDPASVLDELSRNIVDATDLVDECMDQLKAALEAEDRLEARN